MKYIIFSLLIAGLASCSLFNNTDNTSPVPAIVPVVTESGTSVASGSTTQSGAEDMSQSGAVSTETGSNITTSGASVTPSVRPSGATGSTVQTGTTSATEKDPEVEKITKDIDKIFDDIAREGK